MSTEDVYFIRIYRGREIINGTWCSTPEIAHHDGKILAKCFEATRYEVERVSPDEAHAMLLHIIHRPKSSEAASA